jgi:hypothetical protein
MYDACLPIFVVQCNFQNNNTDPFNLADLIFLRFLGIILKIAKFTDTEQPFTREFHTTGKCTRG